MSLTKLSTRTSSTLGSSLSSIKSSQLLTGVRSFHRGSSYGIVEKASADRSDFLQPKPIPQNLKSVMDIPGVPIYPVFGSWPHLVFNKDWKTLKLHDFHSKCFAKYGPIFRICHPGGGNQVFVSDVNDVQDVLRDPYVANSPQRTHFDALIQIRNKKMGHIFKDAGMPFSSGEEWHRVRSVFNGFLLKGKNLELEALLVDEVTKEFIERIRRIRDPITNEVPESFIKELSILGLEVMCNSLMGKRNHNVADDLEEGSFNDDLIESSTALSDAMFNIEFQPQLWRYYHTSSYKRLEETVRKHIDCVDRLLTQRISEIKNGEIVHKDTILEKALMTTSLNNGHIYSTLHELLGSGLEVNSIHAAKLIYCIAKNQSAQTRLQEEVDSETKADEPLTEHKLKSMPYLKGTVNESLRLMPTAMLTNRVVGEYLVLRDYLIPKGWSVTIPLLHMSLDEKNVQRPLEFLPERFIGRNNELRPSFYSFLPFSFGLRQCIGRKLAEILLRNLAVRLAQNFDVGYNHGDLGMISKITMRLDGPLTFTFKDRK